MQRVLLCAGVVALALFAIQSVAPVGASVPEYCDGKVEDPWQDQVCEQWHDPEPPQCLDNSAIPDAVLEAAIWYMKPSGVKLHTCHRVPDGEGECTTHSVPCQYYMVTVYTYEMSHAKCFSYAPGEVAAACVRGQRGGRCKPAVVHHTIDVIRVLDDTCELGVILPNTKIDKQTPLTPTESLN